MNQSPNSNRKMRRTRESAAPKAAANPSVVHTDSTGRHHHTTGNTNTNTNHPNTTVDTMSSRIRSNSDNRGIQQQPLEILSACDYYTIRGDTASAYQALTQAIPDVIAEEANTGSSSGTGSGSGNIISTSTSSSSNVNHPCTMFTIRYNLFLLSELMTATTNKSVCDVLSQWDDLESNFVMLEKATETTAPLYFSYNRALIHYGMSDYTTSIQLCAECIGRPLQQFFSSSNYSSSSSHQNQKTKSTKDSTEPKEPLPFILFHLAFLLLECILALGVGRNTGLNHLLQINVNHQKDTPFNFTIEMILDWLEESMSHLEDADETTSGTTDHYLVEQSQIKFLIPMYKSRVTLSEFDTKTQMRRMDHSTRSARKDMKTAMEIFHNKLRPSYTRSTNTVQINSNNDNQLNATSNETDSVASSVNSTDDRLPTTAAVTSTASPTTSTALDGSSSSPLTKYNQAALSVKAHLEQLKGNTKKSLILCTEAAAGSAITSTGSTIGSNNYNNNNATTALNTLSSDATTANDDTASWYDAIQANNLAVIYATNDRKHLALHGMIKALRANTTMMTMTMTTPHQELSPTMSTAAASTTHTIATEKMETLFSNLFLTNGTVKSDISASLLYNTAICCLRTRNFLSAYECMVSCICHNHNHIFHNRTRCYLYLSDACIGVHSKQLQQQENNKDGGAPRHAHQHIQALVEVDGVPKGIVLDTALYRNGMANAKDEPLAILGSADDISQMKRNPLLRARSCLKYVLQSTADTIDRDVSVSAGLSLCYVELAFGNYRKVRDMVNTLLPEIQEVATNDENKPENIRSLRKRQIATASMYLAEASSALGDLGAARHILGHGNHGQLNQLASNLSGVPLEQVAKNESAQRRLTKAKAMVQSSAAVLTAAMGSTSSGKELARSVNETKATDSSSRRALIYSLLCESNPSIAMEMLLSFDDFQSIAKDV